MAAYTFTAADLRTGAILAELPLRNVALARHLNGAGTFAADLPLGDPGVSKIDPIGSTQPTRTIIYVDRDGQLVGAGIIWTRLYKSDTSTLVLAGRGLWSYFEHRRIRDRLSFVGADQLTIAQGIMNYAQAQPGGFVGVAVNAEVCGVTRDALYNAWDLKPVAEAVQELAQQTGGFDFAIDTAYVAGVPTSIFLPSYPRRGRAQGATGWLFEYPGNIQSFDWPEDGTKAANTEIVQGAGMGAYQSIVAVSNTAQLDAGFPLLEDVRPYKQEIDPLILARYAQSDLTAYAATVVIPTLTVRADQDPVLGSYVEGDDIRVRITDSQRFPPPIGGGPGLDAFYRIVSIEMKPQTDTVPEQVILTLGNPL